MQWLELCIQTCSAGIELVGERLTVLGYDSFIVDDQAEFETFLEQNKQYWDYVDQGLQEKMEGLSQIRLYLEDNAQAMETVRHLQDELQLLRRQNPGKDLGTLEIRISNLQDEDWENISLADLEQTLRAEVGDLYTFSRTSETRTIPDDPETEADESGTEIWYIYTIVYQGEAHFAD